MDPRFPIGNIPDQPSQLIYQENRCPDCLKNEDPFNKVNTYFSQLPGKNSQFLQNNLEAIKKGEEICQKLGNREILEGQHGHESIRAVMLYLKVRSILDNKPNENEMHLVLGKELYEFLKEAGTNPKGDIGQKTCLDSPITYYPSDKGHKSAFYSRASSHYKDTIYKSGSHKQQFGLDIDLWPGRQTVLVGLRQQTINGKTVYSTFLKPEAHGCPPFWKKGFATLENFKNFVHHALGFVGTLKRQLGIQKWPKANTEKINPAEVSKLKKIIQSGIESKKSTSILGDKKIDKKSLEKELSEAKTSIYKLYQLTEKLLQQIGEESSDHKPLKELKKKFKRRISSSTAEETRDLVRGNKEYVHDLSLS